MVSIVDAIISIIIINGVLLAIGGIIFGVASFRNRELVSYLPIYIFFSIGYAFYYYQFVDIIYHIIGVIFFILATLNIFFATSRDYYKIFIRSKKNNSQIPKTVLAALTISPLIITMQIFIIIVLIITSLMLLRIYLRIRSVNKLLFMVCSLAAITGLILQTNPYFELDYAIFIGNAFGTIYISILLVIGIVALLEQEILNTMKIKNQLKDNYSHNLGNILHSISLSYELIKNKISSEIELNELYTLLKSKINEASDLVKEIRNL